MYLPTHFNQENLAELFELIENNPLGSLMVVHDGEIEANHIPFELDRSVGEFGILCGHIAKANPLFDLLENAQSAYVIFQADQAYISPNWYEGKHEHHRVVPTWNYRVVHIKGTIRKIEDDRYLRGVLARLTRMHEANQAIPWKMGDAPKDFIEEQLEKIIAIEIQIDSIIGKFKVSQNRSAVDVERVAKALENQNAEMAKSVRKYYPNSEGSVVIRFKEKRRYLIEFLEVLADFEYQNKFWNQSSALIEPYVDFDMIVHFLLDDTQLFEDAFSEIGCFFEVQGRSDNTQKIDPIDCRIVGKIW